MTISYNWLCTYLSKEISPETCAQIMTAIGLEVEGMEKRGIDPEKLKGLVVGKVMECEKHPNADSLSLTKVAINNGEWLQIVCGAKNVSAGQKVVVATIGTTLYPESGEPFVIKKAKLRGTESFGMLCAGDEIGINSNHDGILVLPQDARIGDNVSNYISTTTDTIMEVGLTPNRSDAMSHRGVARDICAYLSYHEKKEMKPVVPQSTTLPDGNSPISVSIADEKACIRYCGVLIEDITVQDSPDWLKERLEAIGQKPINNIVDITNFILHETGQPLHAFDADKIIGNKIEVKTLAEGTTFITLDDKERKLVATDLMICDAEKPLCIAGVYGGKESGVTAKTKKLFLESACFNPTNIRKTSILHQLRTDAATRFEKGVDVGETKNVLQRAVFLILQAAGGRPTGGITDIYPKEILKKKITLTQSYLHTISGKEYDNIAVGKLLENLGYVVEATSAGWNTEVPHNRPGTNVPAEIVQDIMRIDGLDNILIPKHITISPSTDKNKKHFRLREKTAQILAHSGWFEIFTNSLTNGKWYPEEGKENRVVMLNSLSIELDTLRPDMLPSGLNTIAHNLNRKNSDLRFFESGKTYSRNGNIFTEKAHLALYTTGMARPADWKNRAQPADLFFLKGTISRLLENVGVQVQFKPVINELLEDALEIISNNRQMGIAGRVKQTVLKNSDIKVPVYFADLFWQEIEKEAADNVSYREVSKFPAAQRDLALVVDKKVAYADIELATEKANLPKLRAIELFDVFENEKLGTNKKSMAISYTFTDENKTLIDEEMDKMVQQLISIYEKELNAEIRRQ